MSEGQVHRGLYPIIRRKRQPLVADEPPRASAAGVVPVSAPGGEKALAPPAGKARKGKDPDGTA